jgi:lambda repressor-like predicted transcriptional regulator
MADSTFWRDLATQFQALHTPHRDIRADWQYKAGSMGIARWNIVGDPSLKVQFEALARRAAIGIPNRRSQDLLVAWLEGARELASRVGAVTTSFGNELNEDNSVRTAFQFGSIDRLCEASASMCKILESRALQAEFEENERNDPKNWSPLRQRFEAFKKLKQLYNEPPEQIPEALARNSIAEQYGITPEEVTQEQIQFEVAGLLCDYPAITVIPQGDAPTGIIKRQNQQTPELTEKTKDIPTARKAFVEAILTEKGWSILDWANEAQVAYHTAADYLAGTKNPYRSTRVKLAKALGVPPNNLPD